MPQFVFFFFFFYWGIRNNLIFKKGLQYIWICKNRASLQLFNINSGVSASEFDKLHIEINFLIGNARVDESHLTLTNIVFIYLLMFNC